MTTAKRAYINKMYNQFVDDQCLQFRSVPMAVVNKILKPNRPMSEYTGVKRVFNNVPARPINLNALATTIARMGNMPYSQVDAISMRIAEEEVREVKAFVKGNKDPFEEPVGFAPQKYVAEKAIRTTLGVPLAPDNRLKKEMYMTTGGKSPALDPVSGVVERAVGQAREVSLLLGDEAQTYNTPQFVSEITGKPMKYTDKVNPMSYLNEVAAQRTKEIMREARIDKQGFVQFPKGEENLRAYLGIEPVPQVGHTTKRMDALFGPAYQKNIQDYYPVQKPNPSSKNE